MTSRIRTACLAAACAAAVALLLVPGDASATSQASAAATTSPSVTCSTVNFEKATVERDAVTGRLTLVVTGYNPGLGMTDALMPLKYGTRPPYWAVAVVGCGPRYSPPMVESYTVKLDVTRTVGTIGIEVIGLVSTLKIPVTTVTTVTPTPGPR
jgi:hypothetical protein